LHPILFRAGSFQLPTYGVILAAALLAAVFVVMRLGKREGLDTGRLFDFSTWLIIVALVGAKVLMVLTDWQYYWQHPGELVSWGMFQAGGVFYGGFIAAVFFAVWYTRSHQMSIWKVFDVYAPAIALGQGIGRWGCFAAGDDYGKPTNFFIHVVFTDPMAHRIGGVPLGVPVHPVQLYESALTLMIFGFLMWKFRRKTFDGQIFVLYLALYAVARFFLEFLRGDPDRGFVFHHLLSTSQFIALLALIAAAGLALYLRKRPREAVETEAVTPAGKHGRK
jgi:phosphatidylglycerol---prolipoprotein diacylglyceryl transferase